MEAELINSAVGLSTGQITGGGFLTVFTLSILAYLKYNRENKSDKKSDEKTDIDVSAELELKLRKFLSETVLQVMTKISNRAVLSNEQIAQDFIKYLEKHSEKQAVINQSFTKVYDKIDSESEKTDAQIKHIENNWVHKDTLRAELKTKKDLGT